MSLVSRSLAASFVLAAAVSTPAVAAEQPPAATSSPVMITTTDKVGDVKIQQKGSVPAGAVKKSIDLSQAIYTVDRDGGTLTASYLVADVRDDQTYPQAFYTSVTTGAGVGWIQSYTTGAVTVWTPSGSTSKVCTGARVYASAADNVVTQVIPLTCLGATKGSLAATTVLVAKNKQGQVSTDSAEGTRVVGLKPLS